MNELDLRPYTTEKTASLGKINKFVFLADTSLKKIQVSQFLSFKYKVTVKSISVLKKRSKQVRRGKILGKTKCFKKFIVTVVEDENLSAIRSQFG